MKEARSRDRTRPALGDRLHARLAGRARMSPGFTPHDDISGTGSELRGARLLAQEARLAGQVVALGGGTIWDPPLPPEAEDARQAFGWLDDLAAVGDAEARALAQTWACDWMRRFGRGAGWRAEVVGARMLRWLGQGRFLTRGLEDEELAHMGRVLGRQLLFLARRWQRAPAGLPRLTALAALAEGAAGVSGFERHRPDALAALAAHCDAVVDAEGGIASRSPVELLDILALLNRVCRQVSPADPILPPAIDAARQRIAPVLRALRHADGRLARFHGGGRGAGGALDAALAESGSRTRHQGLAMGYARLAAGRSTVIMDAAPPPRGLPNAHAATLAFELTSGRRPVIVNCGSGAGYGAEWARAARATASQSVLGLDGFSSARLGPGGDERLSEAPATVPGESALTATSHRMGAAHDGWQRTHGLMYARTLDLTLDGRALTGEELLIALDATDQATFARARADTGGAVAFSIRFHLHPEAEPQLAPDGSAVTITLRSGEIWELRQDGAENISLRASVWLEPGRAVPRATQQVVLSGRAIDYATRVRWSLMKTPETPNALRDLGPEPEEDA